jgi:hypothetical protein
MLWLRIGARLHYHLFIDRRKTNREDDVIGLVVLEIQFAMVPVYDASGDCKTETGTTFFRGKEWLKDMICDAAWDRRTGIFNPDLKSLSGLLYDGNQDAPALRRSFDGIAHKVQKCLLQLAFIAIDATGIAHLDFNL